MKTRHFLVPVAFPAALSVLLLAPASLAQSDAGPTDNADAWQNDTGVPSGQCAADADCGPGQHCGIDGLCWNEGDGPCESDADCGEGYACLYEWCAPAEACASDADCWTGFCGPGGYCATPPSCGQDADCPEGDICDWGYCAPKGSRCHSDAECPAMAYCDPDYWTGISGSGSAGGAVPVYDAGASADAASGDVPPGETGTDWGACVVDPSQITVTADCQTVCAAVVPCMAEGDEPPPSGADAGSAPGPGAVDPGAQESCELICSYGDATGALGEGDLQALLTCLTNNPTCDEMATQCGAQIGAIGDALENLPVELAYDDEPAVVEEDPSSELGPSDDIGPGPSGDTAVSEPMDYPDATAPAQDAGATTDSAGPASSDAQGTSATDAGATDGGQGADGVTSPDAGGSPAGSGAKADDAGCNAGGTAPTTPAALLLLALLGLAARRRRA